MWFDDHSFTDFGTGCVLVALAVCLLGCLLVCLGGLTGLHIR
jgi:hypothetical protein